MIGRNGASFRFDDQQASKKQRHMAERIFQDCALNTVSEVVAPVRADASLLGAIFIQAFLGNVPRHPGRASPGIFILRQCAEDHAPYAGQCVARAKKGAAVGQKLNRSLA